MDIQKNFQLIVAGNQRGGEEWRLGKEVRDKKRQHC
jgi:hypothetical protein